MFLRALFAFLALPGVVAFGVPAILAWRAGPPAGLRILGVVPMAPGVAGLLLCVGDFYRTGRGTLATWDPPKRLVTVGLYRYTRNPMYVSVLLILLGWTALSASPFLLAYTAAVGTAFHLHVVFREEPWQARTFGEEWLAYRARVPRWLGVRRCPMLVLVKTLHTAVWAFMVACILGIYAFAHVGRFGLSLAMIAIVTGEVMVLVWNGMRCPLTSVAGRFTEDRRPNFDICLPEWLARYNKEIFGTLYVGGILYALVLWVVA